MRFEMHDLCWVVWLTGPSVRHLGFASGCVSLNLVRMWSKEDVTKYSKVGVL
jgi:hypothetical protein